VETVQHAVLITVAGLAVGLGSNAVSPHPVPLGRAVHAAAESADASCSGNALPQGEVPRIAVKDATAMCTACSAAFVDARSAREYEAGHIVNALHLPPMGHPDEAAVLRDLGQHASGVVYDGETSCRLAEGVARRLIAMGLQDVRVLDGAWPAWVEAGGPGAAGTCGVCAHAGHDEPNAESAP